MNASPIPSIAVVGIHGFGRSHVDDLVARSEAGTARIAGLVDPAPPRDDVPGPHFPDLESLLSATTPDIVIIATPIQTHAELAIAAIEAGSDVLLEKPPTATLDEFQSLRAAAERHGALCQIGFQSLGSAAIDDIRRRVADGAIGDLVRVTAGGWWVRDSDYFNRAPWAGRRTMNGRVVGDGALTNPFAHAAATACALISRQRLEDVAGVELDLYRANDIESDDTSAARIRFTDGAVIAIAVTLCADQPGDPFVRLEGTTGTIVHHYIHDLVEEYAIGDPIPHVTKHHRVMLLDDLIAVRAGALPGLMSPLEDAGAFMALLDAVVSGPEPLRIAAQHRVEVADALGRRVVVDGAAAAVKAALRTGSTFAELEIPWAVRLDSSTNTVQREP